MIFLEVLCSKSHLTFIVVLQKLCGCLSISDTMGVRRIFSMIIILVIQNENYSKAHKWINVGIELPVKLNRNYKINVTEHGRDGRFKFSIWSSNLK